MLEQLMGLIKDHSQDAIVNNPAIPNEHNNAAMQTILSSVVGGLANQQAAGNSSGLWSLLSGAAGGNVSNNPIVSGIANSAISGLMEKFGLDKNAAGGIISAVLPQVMGSLINKTNDPNDSSFDLSSIMGAVMGGGAQQQGGGLGNILGSVLGGAGQQQGGGGLGDILGSVLGGGQQAQQQPQGGGGLGDLLGSVLGGGAQQQQQPQQQQQQGGGLMDMLNVFLKSQQQ
jgi:uncharacterized protein YidB (DUF937 family)